MRQSKNAVSVVYAAKRGYYVNADGEVVSPRGVIRKRIWSHKGGGIRKRDGRKRLSYAYFTVRFDGKNRKVAHHQLCAYQKFGEAALTEGTQVRHLDGDPTNNRPENIAIGDAHDNIMDRSREDRVAQAKRAAKVLRRLSDDQVREIRSLRKKGWTINMLRGKFGGPKSAMSYIINRKTYADVL